MKLADVEEEEDGEERMVEKLEGADYIGKFSAVLLSFVLPTPLPLPSIYNTLPLPPGSKLIGEREEGRSS